MRFSLVMVVVGLILGFLFVVPKEILAATFTVTNTTDDSDTSPGDGVCTTGVVGQCSLKAAIQEANALAGADTINFNIPTSDSGYRDFDNPNTPSSGDSADGDDYWTIRTTSGLPNITSQVTIDGTTQTTNQGDTNTYGPEIELKGPNSAGTLTGPNGLYFYTGSTNSLVKGLVINAFNSGIYIHLVSNITIKGCYVGTDIEGATASANYYGIQFRDNVQNLTVGGTSPGDGNLLSGNSYQGMGSGVGSGSGGSGNVYVLGNYIGTDRTGNKAIPNVHHGIALARQAYNVYIGDGTVAGRNVISGNLDENVLARHESYDIYIKGNYIGIGADGITQVYSNTIYNILLFEAIHGITVGGSNPSDGNLIAYTLWFGVYISSTGSYNNTITNNTIYNNHYYGVAIGSNSTGNTVSQNTIYNNGTGINLIGTGTGNTFTQNLVYNNSKIDIDLGDDGITPNDVGDTDTGVNHLMNYPVIDLAQHIGGNNYKIKGRMDFKTSEAPITIEIFESSGNYGRYGGSTKYLGSANVSTNPATSGTWEATVDVPESFNGTKRIVFTTTATNSLGDTSEFSLDQVVGDSVPQAQYSTCQEKGPTSPPAITKAVSYLSSVLLYFNPPSGDYTYYFLEYGTSSNKYWYGNSYIGSKPMFTFLVTNLSPGTTYYFRVGASNGCASGGWSNEISSTTLSTDMKGTGTITPTPGPTSKAPQTQPTQESTPLQQGQKTSSTVSKPLMVIVTSLFLFFFLIFLKKRRKEHTKNL